MRWLTTGLLLLLLSLLGASEILVEQLRGAAVVLPAHGDRWQAAQLGQVLHNGDRLRVIEAPGHHARLSLPQASQVHVGPGSVIEATADGSLRLRHGQLGVYQAADLGIALGGDGETQRWHGSLVLDASSGPLDNDAIPDWVRGLAMADARQAGLSLLGTGSDGSRHLVQPADISVEVRIADGLAHCSLEVGFQQHARGMHESELQLPLPAQAAVDGFALYQSWSGWQAASVLERQRGRAIWQELLSERIDPALLEWEAGSIFRMRVFPVHNSTRMRVQWIEPLHDGGDGNAQWRLALSDLVPSDALLPQLRIRVLVPHQHGAAVIGGAFDPRITRAAGGMEILDTGEALQQPIADWQLKLASSPQWLREDNDDSVVLRQRADTPVLPAELNLQPMRLLLAVDRSAQSLQGEHLQRATIHALCDLLPSGSTVRLAAVHLDSEILDEGWWDPSDMELREQYISALNEALPLGAANHRAGWASAAALNADAVLYLGSGQDSFHSQPPAAHEYDGRWLALGLGPRANAAGLAQWGRDGALRAVGLDDLPQALARVEALLAGFDSQPLLPAVEGIDPSQWFPTEDGAGNALWFARLPLDHPSLNELAELPRAQGAGLLSRAQLQAEVVHLSRQQPSPEGQARLRQLGDAHGLLTPLHALLVLDSDAMRARFGIEAVLPPSSGSGERDVADGKLLTQLQKRAHRQAIDQVGAMRHAAGVHLGLGMRQVWPPDADHRLEGRGAILGFSSPRGFDLFGNGGSGESFISDRIHPEDMAVIDHPLGDDEDATDDNDSLSSLLASSTWVHPLTALDDLPWDWRLLLDQGNLDTRQYWPLEPGLWDLDAIAPPFFDTSVVPQQRMGSSLRKGTVAGQGQSQWRVRYVRADGEATVELLVHKGHWLLRWEDSGRRFARWHDEHSRGVVDIDAGIAKHFLSPLHSPGLPMLPGASAPTLEALAHHDTGQQVITHEVSNDGLHLRWWEDHYLRHEAWFTRDADGPWRCQRERSHHPDGSHSNSTWSWDMTPFGKVPVAIEHDGQQWTLHWDHCSDDDLEQALNQLLSGTLSLPGAPIQALPQIAHPRLDPHLLKDLAEAIDGGLESAEILRHIREQAPRLHPLFIEGWAQAGQGGGALDKWLEDQATGADSPLARELIEHWRRHRGWLPEPRPKQEPAPRAWPKLQAIINTKDWEAAILRHRATYGAVGAVERLCAIIPETKSGERIAEIAIRVFNHGGSASDAAALDHLLRWMLDAGNILIPAAALPLIMNDQELLNLLQERLSSRGDLAWRQAGSWEHSSSPFTMRLNPFQQRVLNGTDHILVRAWQQGAKRGDPPSLQALLRGFAQTLADVLPIEGGPTIPQSTLMSSLSQSIYSTNLDYQGIASWLSTISDPLAHLQGLDPLPQWAHRDLQVLIEASSTLVLHQFPSGHRQQREEAVVALWQRWAEALPPDLGPYLRLAAAEIEGRYNQAAAIATIRPLATSDDPALALTALYSWAAVNSSDGELRAMVEERSQQPAAWHERRLQLLLALTNGEEIQHIIEFLAVPQIEGPLWATVSAFLHAANGDYERALDHLNHGGERLLPQASLLRARLLQALGQALDITALRMLHGQGLDEFDLFAADLVTPPPGLQAAELAACLANGDLVQALRLVTKIDNHLAPEVWQQALRTYAETAFAPRAPHHRSWQNPIRALYRAWQDIASRPLAEDLRHYWQQRNPADFSPRATVWLELILHPPQDPYAIFTTLQALAAVGDEQALNWLTFPDPIIDGGEPPDDFLQQSDSLKTWSVTLAPRSWLEPAFELWLRGANNREHYQSLLEAFEQRVSNPGYAPWAVELLGDGVDSDIAALRQRLHIQIQLATMLDDMDVVELAALLPAIGADSNPGANRLLHRHLRSIAYGAWGDKPGVEALIIAAHEHAATQPALQLELWRVCGADEVIIHHRLGEENNTVTQAWSRATTGARNRAAQQLAEELWRLAPQLGPRPSARIPWPNRAAAAMVYDHFANLCRAAIPDLSDQQRHQVLTFLNSRHDLRHHSLRQDLLTAIAESGAWPHRQAQWEYLRQVLGLNPDQAATWYRQHGSDLPASEMRLNDALRLSIALHQQDAKEVAEHLWREWCANLAQGQVMGTGDMWVSDDLITVLENHGLLKPLITAIEQRLNAQRDHGLAHDPWAGQAAMAARSQHQGQHLWAVLAMLAQAAGEEALALRALIQMRSMHSLEDTTHALARLGDAQRLLAAMDAQHMGLPTLRAKIADRLLSDGEGALGEAVLAAALQRWPQHPHVAYTMLSLLITTQPEGEAPDLTAWRPIILHLNEASAAARRELIARFRWDLGLTTTLRLHSHALGMKPQRPEALRELARTILDTTTSGGRALDLGLLAAEQGHRANPDQAETVLIWARLLDRAQRSDEARLILRQAIARDDWPAEDRFHIAEMSHFYDQLLAP